jgi:hypothetical protein
MPMLATQLLSVPMPEGGMQMKRPRDDWQTMTKAVWSHDQPPPKNSPLPCLSALIVDNLTQVRDKSVAYAFRGIIQRVVKLACGED